MASYWHAPLQLYKIWDVAGLDIDQPPSAQPPRRGVGGTRALAHSIYMYTYIYIYIPVQSFSTLSISGRLLLEEHDMSESSGAR